MIIIGNEQESSFPDHIVLTALQIEATQILTDLNDGFSLCKEIMLDTQVDRGQDVENFVIRALFTGGSG